MTEPVEEFKSVRLDKLAELRKQQIDPFPYAFSQTHHAADILKDFEKLQAEEETSEEVHIAGRIMTKRGHGKASFAHIQDESGKIQIYAKFDLLGAETYTLFEKLDMGDFIGVQGKVFRTKRGEISVKIKALTLLAKSLHPLPEKWHGLQDKELRYRERHVDLIANHDVKETFLKRSHIIQATRAFLHEQGFLEVETPVLHTLAGGAAARPFKTYHNALDMDLYLRIALELHLKRLLVGGFEKVFEIGRVFRNEGISFKHNPEYTLLELYQAYVDYEAMMQLTESLFVQVAKEILGTTKLTYQNHEIDLTPPWKRVTLAEAVENALHIQPDKMSEKELEKLAREKGGAFESGIGKGWLINYLYDECVEPTLIQPTFIVDYPIETSPLAKKKRGNPGLVERFELIIAGMEFANAFSELNDPLDQRERFEAQMRARASGDEEAHQLDEDFLKAIEVGMPPAGGLGIGMDRLVMLLTNSHSIRDVILFPHMRPTAKQEPVGEKK